MSSASSTEPRPDRDSGFQPWQLYLLLSMAGATWAVIVSRDTHPVALLLISAAVMAAGLVAAALHYALMGFFGGESQTPAPATGRTREYLEREKALVLRSIKELEFDHAMRKVGEKDFAELGGRLRARAMELMEALDSPQSLVPGPQSSRTQDRGPGTKDDADDLSRCPSCSTVNDSDAKFCKQCGAKL